MRNRTENQINLILIRHGETPSNALGRYLGRTEEDLSEAGKEKLLLIRKQESIRRRISCFQVP